MDLLELISKAPVKVLKKESLRADNPEVLSLAYDSRQVDKGSLFFAVQGESTDGHRYIGQALERGAIGIVSERPAEAAFDGVPWVQVEAIRPAMAVMANRFFGDPSQRLRLVGITGTNGKTTTAFLVHSVLEAGGPSLLMGTIKTVVGAKACESQHTTPEAIDIQGILRQAIDSGCRYGVMEVSSHALALNRVYQCRFPVAVFTNLTQDHLDFHGTLEDYFAAKHRLFEDNYNPGLRYALVNSDDPFCSRLRATSVKRFGLGCDADVYPLRESGSLQGTTLQLAFFGRKLALESTLIGRHNTYNLMAAAGACSLLGLPDAQIREGIASLKQVPGRFEKVDIKAPFSAVVDYAHTPDALQNVLRLARQLTSGRIICVFGCGGDRDRRKRPLMGSIAVREADLVVVTSDNPRSEDPEFIIREILAGIPPGRKNYDVVVDRRQAIGRAVRLALPGDLVLIAGKGHETYQLIGGRTTHFDDREVVKELM